MIIIYINLIKIFICYFTKKFTYFKKFYLKIKSIYMYIACIEYIKWYIIYKTIYFSIKNLLKFLKLILKFLTFFSCFIFKCKWKYFFKYFTFYNKVIECILFHIITKLYWKNKNNTKLWGLILFPRNDITLIKKLITYNHNYIFTIYTIFYIK